jgi:UDP-N-acetylmuramoylalanine--D-glutamate ligase
MDDAVKAASQLAGDGDVVLLSPACASWDMFKDFEERGNAFKRSVRRVIEA